MLGFYMSIQIFPIAWLVTGCPWTGYLFTPEILVKFFQVFLAGIEGYQVIASINFAVKLRQIFSTVDVSTGLGKPSDPWLRLLC